VTEHPNQPSVAVIIPCWNAEKWVARAIQSALDQNYPNLEVIVIDDGSTDSSLDVIRSFGDRIRWETGPNRGACAARNRGLALTTAEYVIFLDADDYIEVGSLAAWAMTAQSADLVLAPFAIERSGVKKHSIQPHQSADVEAVLRNWLQGVYTPSCSVLWRTAFLNRIGGWNEHAIRNQDGELVIRALLDDARVALAEAGLGVYVQHQSTGRVSRRTGRDVLLNLLEQYSNLLQLAKSRGFAVADQAFAHAFYGLACEAYSGRCEDLGTLALRRARELGLRGHVGSLAHRALATALGLRVKVRVSGLLRGRLS